jgi:hypothetical protein
VTGQADAILQPPVTRLGPSREDRAARAYLLLGLFVAAIFAFVTIGASGFTPLERSVRLAPAVVSVITPFVAYYGLAWRRPWAVAAVDIILVITIVEGLADALVAATHSTLLLPLGTIAGVWAFRAPHAPWAATARLSAMSAALIGLFLVGALGSVAGGTLLTPGGPLLVGEADLAADMDVDCGPTVGVPPETITLRYRWSWGRMEGFAAGEDRINITWVDEADGGVTGYQLDETQLPSGVIEWDRQIDPPLIIFATELADAQVAAVEVRLVIRRVIPDRPQHGLVQFEAHYFHNPNNYFGPGSASGFDVGREAACVW